jgi:hypothetical protein
MAEALQYQDQALQVADRMATAVIHQERALQVADVITAQYATQDQALSIADVIASQYAAQERALQIADVIASQYAAQAQALGAVVNVADFADRLVSTFANILLNPDECAAWYLEIDPPRQPLVRKSNPVPPAMKRPNFPAPPMPGVSAANAREQFRAVYQQNPAMAWRALDAMRGADLANLFG